MEVAIFILEIFIALILLAIGASLEGCKKGIIAFVLEMQKASIAAAERAKKAEEEEND